VTFASYARSIARLHARAGRKLVLGRPAAEARVRALEKGLGWKIPSGLRSAWRAADGGRTDSPVFARPGFLTGYDFLSVGGARAARESMRKRATQYDGYVEPRPRDRRIGSGWFRAGWLPFASFGGGSLLLLVDVTPSAAGTKGQVIAFTHDPDEITWVSRSFASFLAASARAFAKDHEELLLL
jgi:cell wall assembly regulator SMI1